MLRKISIEIKDKIFSSSGGCCCGGSCFPSRVKVLTKNGYKFIEGITPGDVVFSFNIRSQKWSINQ